MTLVRRIRTHHRSARAVAAAFVAVALALITSTAAVAKSYTLAGTAVEENGGIPTGGNLDPQNMTLTDSPLILGTATLTGSWTGQNLTKPTVDLNLSTGAATCTYKETFTGRAAWGGVGTVNSEGTCVLGPEDSTGAQTFQADARIVCGTGDFAGASGYIHYRGTFYDGDGPATYYGRLDLPDRRPTRRAAAGRTTLGGCQPNVV